MYHNQVAQVLRHAQIIIKDMKLNDVTFVLTNSLDKTEVAWTTHINISAHPEELVKVYQFF